MEKKKTPEHMDRFEKIWYVGIFLPYIGICLKKNFVYKSKSWNDSIKKKNT